MNIISIGIIVTAVITTLLILLQERGGGTGSIFGGSEGGAYQHRRGMEKFIFIATIFFAASFAALNIVNLTYPEKPAPTQIEVTPTPPASTN